MHAVPCHIQTKGSILSRVSLQIEPEHESDIVAAVADKRAAAKVRPIRVYTPAADPLAHSPSAPPSAAAPQAPQSGLLAPPAAGHSPPAPSSAGALQVPQSWSLAPPASRHTPAAPASTGAPQRPQSVQPAPPASMPAAGAAADPFQPPPHPLRPAPSLEADVVAFGGIMRDLLSFAPLDRDAGVPTSPLRNSFGASTVQSQLPTWLPLVLMLTIESCVGGGGPPPEIGEVIALLDEAAGELAAGTYVDAVGREQV